MKAYSQQVLPIGAGPFAIADFAITDLGLAGLRFLCFQARDYESYTQPFFVRTVVFLHGLFSLSAAVSIKQRPGRNQSDARF